MVYSIKVDVADLRSISNPALPNDYSHQDARLSQCNKGDLVELLKEEGDWSYVSALEQLQWSNRSWQGYRGWLHASEIEKSSTPHPHSFIKKVSKDLLLKECQQFIGLPYLWGGCSLPIQDKIASVDCSGLMFQLFKKQGRLIPRDAHDQYLAADRVKEGAPGDLLFLRPLSESGTPAKRVTHVILLYDHEHFLEAPESGKQVRFLKIGSAICKKNGLYTIFDRPKAYLGSFGRF